MIILGMALVTVTPRMLPVVALASRSLPPALARWLSYVPVAVLAAMLFPALLVQDGRINVGAGNLFLLASIPTFFVAWKTRSLFGSVMVGMILVAAGRALLGM